MAALSLKCNTCGVALRSMREAQDHGEATGHADFSESTEAVLTLVRTQIIVVCAPQRADVKAASAQVCADCGKPCRSQTEVDVHTKRTGHFTFTDKTAEAAKPMVCAAERRCQSVLRARPSRRAASPADAPRTSRRAARRTARRRCASCVRRKPASTRLQARCPFPSLPQLCALPHSRTPNPCASQPPAATP
jgi:hypothetical protein